MATTQMGSETVATCPLCRDYKGPPSSVEAHISRSVDPVHQGEVGRAHRDDLERQVENTDEVDSSEDQGPDIDDNGDVEGVEESTDDPSVDGGPRSEDSDTTVPEDSHPPADQLGRTFDSEESDDVDVLEDDQEESDDDRDADDGDDQPDRADQGESGVGGIPIPVSSGTLIASVAAFVVIVYLYRRSQRQPDQQSQQDEQSQQEPAQSGGGLVDTDAATVEELVEAMG